MLELVLLLKNFLSSSFSSVISSNITISQYNYFQQSSLGIHHAKPSPDSQIIYLVLIFCLFDLLVLPLLSLVMFLFLIWYYTHIGYLTLQDTPSALGRAQNKRYYTMTQSMGSESNTLNDKMLCNATRTFKLTFKLRIMQYLSIRSFGFLWDMYSWEII